MLWAVRDSEVRTAQEEHGCPSSFTLKSSLRPIHSLYSLLLCSFPWKMLSQIKPSVPNVSIYSAVPRHLSVVFVWYSTSQMSVHDWGCFTMLHYSLLILLAQSSTQASADFTSFSLSVLLSVTVSVSSLSVFMHLFYSIIYALPPLPLFGLQAEVLDSQRRSTGLNDGLVNGVTDNSAN